MVYTALGLMAAAAINLLDVQWLDAERDVAVLEHVAEAAVVVTLYATGLQIDRELRLASWRTVVLLLCVVMPLTIGVVSQLVRADTFAWGQIMAGALMAALPPVVIYAFLMDYYIAGLTAGATKG